MIYRKLKNEELGRISEKEFRAAIKTPVVVVLDNIRSAHNVGSVFRTSDAFLLEAVFLCGYTPCPPNREIHKTALGATGTVLWKYFKSGTDAVAELKSSGYRIVVVEQTENSVPLNNFGVKKGEKTAVVFGSEVGGVDQHLIDLADLCVEIPQSGTKHSLNIAVCAGIVLWDMFLKMNK